MAKLRLVVEGDLGSITVKAFEIAVRSYLRMLREYDVALSEERNGSLDWVITAIHGGSAVIELESRSRFEEKNIGPDVAQQFVRGWRQIEQQGTTPPYLSPSVMEQTRRMLKLIGREGTTGYLVSDLSEEVEITSKSSVNIDRLLRERDHSIGSVEGRIETVSIHGRPRFILYHSRTQHAILCSVPKERLAELAPTAILGSRVVVFGMLHSNALGEVLRIDVERVRRLRRESELPTIESLSGSDPDFTGDLTTAEYIRGIRRG
jgi:hypothetical protein